MTKKEFHLELAAIEGNIAKIEKALNKSLFFKAADINTSFKDGTTALIVATQNHRTEAINYLLAKGADKNRVDSKGFTAFAYSLKGKDEEISIKLIPDKKELIEAKTLPFPLSLAFKNKFYILAQILLEKGANPNCTFPKSNISVLVHCIQDNLPILAELLIKSGADVNNQAVNGLNPLYCAVQKDSYQIVNLLLSNGAKLYMPEEISNTPQSKQTKNKKGENNANDIYEPVLCIAIKNKNDKIAQCLIQAGADINLAGTDNKPPLYFAIETKQPRIAEMLITKGVQLNNTPDYLNGLLQLAISIENIEITELLLKNGANPDFYDKHNQIPLCEAILKKNIKLIDLLISYNCTINLRDDNNMHALLAASIVEDIEIFELLINKGAKLMRVELGHKSEYGTRYLRSAIINKEEKECIKIVRQGFDLNATVYNSEGDEDDCLLATAASFELTRLIREMIVHKVDVNHFTYHKPFKIITDRNFKDVILLMIAAGVKIDDVDCIYNLVENRQNEILMFLTRHKDYLLDKSHLLSIAIKCNNFELVGLLLASIKAAGLPKDINNLLTENGMPEFIPLIQLVQKGQSYIYPEKLIDYNAIRNFIITVRKLNNKNYTDIEARDFNTIYELTKKLNKRLVFRHFNLVALEKILNREDYVNEVEERLPDFGAMLKKEKLVEYIQCKRCKGSGGGMVRVPYTDRDWEFEDCEDCNGSGKIEDIKYKYSIVMNTDKP